jgi:hypothetical protein
MWRTPTPFRAAITALATAAGAATVGNSPTPFAPVGVKGEGVSTVAVSKTGVLQVV